MKQRYFTDEEKRIGKKEADRKRYLRNKEAVLDRVKRYAKDNPQKRKELQRKACIKLMGDKDRMEKKKKTAKAYRDRRRRKVLTHYGGICACCGESRYEFLAIDHINNDGYIHRKEVGGNICVWIVRNNFPKNLFQVLCHNCNFAKGVYGKCPHKL